jgi:hypothetical protein
MPAMASVDDEIADDCLTDVESFLGQYITEGGTICLVADAWTKTWQKAQKFYFNSCLFHCQVHA